jgi:hypothetical protein
MTRQRLLTATLIAFAAAAIPVTTDADAAVGVKLSTAACAEAGCGSLSLIDCFCPDMQFPNLRPQCDDPPED